MSKRENSPSSVGTFIKREWPMLLLLIGAFALGIVLYPHIPDPVPSHWNYRGEVDGYTAKPFGVFQIPIMASILYALFFIVPRVDPRKENYKKFAGSYRLMQVVIIVFLIGLYFLTILGGLGYAVDIGLIVRLAVGLLLTFIGNMMGQFRHNYFIGIRTPWTLASEDVWRKTHRVAGPLWVVGGLVITLSAFLPGWVAIWILYISIMIMVGYPFLYSYRVYRTLNSKTN